MFETHISTWHRLPMHALVVRSRAVDPFPARMLGSECMLSAGFVQLEAAQRRVVAPPGKLVIGGHAEQVGNPKLTTKPPRRTEKCAFPSLHPRQHDLKKLQPRIVLRSLSCYYFLDKQSTQYAESSPDMLRGPRDAKSRQVGANNKSTFAVI